MSETVINNAEEKKSMSFVEEQVVADLAAGKNGNRLQTRFPPEPNGYLHIGHAKAIAIDFGLAQKYGGVCNLRMDDTNPQKEDIEYVNAIKRDIEWLGFKWGEIYYASDYFQELWDFAVWCIKTGRAYVDEQTSEEIAQQKGTPTQAGTNSPYRDRPVEESLALFEKMNSGHMEPGKAILRAKIDMSSPNMHFRDPIMYRVLNMPHWRTGNKWNAYPMYDYTHGQCDYWEGVTHSWCTLEFVSHRPLYDLFVDWAKQVGGDDQPLDDNRPRQTEFNKLNLTHILLSKRNLLILVKEGIVNGWDDPRMPTISGFRRRGYSPEGILSFIDKIGYTKFDALNQMSLFEAAVRDDLNKRADRVSAVCDPIKLVLTNIPEDAVEVYQAINNPELKDAEGNVVELKCTYDPSTRPGGGEWRSVKGTIHWVSAAYAKEIELRNYDRLFTLADMSQVPEDKDYKDYLNPESLTLGKGWAEPAMLEDNSGIAVQFERTGYYVKDKDSTADHVIFNKTTALKDSYKPE